MPDMKLQEREEFRQHWPLVMAASIGFAFSSIVSASTGLFMEPLAAEFGWGRALTSSGASITAVLTFLMSPFFGVLIDRKGTRWMALFGTVFAGLLIAGFSLNTGSPWLWVAMWTVYAFAAVMIKSTVWTAAVSSVFTAGRGLALGLTLSGTALAQAVIPPLTNALIDAFDWRGAYIWLGLGGGGIAFLACYFFLFDGYAIARRQRAADARAGIAESPAEDGALLNAPGLSMAEAWRSAALQKIAFTTFIMMVITIALNVHQFEILRSTGMSRTDAAYLSSIAGIAGIVGKLVTGWLLDRYHARWVGGITLGVSSLAFVILLLPNLTTTLILVAMVINGYSAGTKLQVTSYLVSAYGGMRHFGAIFGVIASLIAAGSGLGPVLAGLIFDTYGSYQPFLIGGVAGSILSGLLIFSLRDYPEWARKVR